MPSSAVSARIALPGLNDCTGVSVAEVLAAGRDTGKVTEPFPIRHCGREFAHLQKNPCGPLDMTTTVGIMTVVDGHLSEVPYDET